MGLGPVRRRPTMMRRTPTVESLAMIPAAVGPGICSSFRLKRLKIRVESGIGEKSSDRKIQDPLDEAEKVAKFSSFFGSSVLK